MNGLRRYVLLLAVLAIPLLLDGCANLHRPAQKLQVTLSDMQLVEMRPLEAVIQLSLRVVNPNDFDLAINGVSCEIFVDGRKFASGVGKIRTELPAFDGAVVPVTVYASTLKMFGSLFQLLQRHSDVSGPVEPLHYELRGRARLEGGIRQTVPFASKGTLDFLTVPPGS